MNCPTCQWELTFTARDFERNVSRYACLRCNERVEAPIDEARPPYHPQRELERLRAAIARHHELRHSRTLPWNSAWQRDQELYVAAGLEPPEVLE